MVLALAGAFQWLAQGLAIAIRILAPLAAETAGQARSLSEYYGATCLKIS